MTPCRRTEGGCVCQSLHRSANSRRATVDACGGGYPTEIARHGLGSGRRIHAGVRFDAPVLGRRSGQTRRDRRDRGGDGALQHRERSRAAAVHVFFESEIDDVRTIAPKASFITVPTGFDVPKDEWSGGGGYLSWIGRIDPVHKGLDVLVRAIDDAGRAAADVLGPERVPSGACRLRKAPAISPRAGSPAAPGAAGAPAPLRRRASRCTRAGTPRTGGTGRARTGPGCA